MPNVSRRSLRGLGEKQAVFRGNFCVQGIGPQTITLRLERERAADVESKRALEPALEPAWLMRIHALATRQQRKSRSRLGRNGQHLLRNR